MKLAWSSRTGVWMGLGMVLTTAGCLTPVGGEGGSGGGTTTTSEGGINIPGTGGSGGALCLPETEICDGYDNDCDDEIDEVEGGCACIVGSTRDCYSGSPDTTAGVGPCKKGTQSCEDGTWGACEGQVTPVPETCNDVDDNCDGTADNAGVLTCGVGECATSVTTCLNGELQTCLPLQPGVEVCDGKDNDCDNLTDETDPELGNDCTTALPGECELGKMMCKNNGGSPALTCMPNKSPIPEKCNGLDDNCDGEVDNGIPGTGGDCNTGLLGTCGPGTFSCKDGVVACHAINPPVPEVCDLIDNDCNGAADDGDPGGGTVCDTGVPGICGPGVLHCVSGAVTCVPDQIAGTDECNGLDDNCNGQIDEGDPGGGFDCFTGLDGVCAAGITSCTSGNIECNQLVQASAETCNDEDDDCDGLIDDGNPGGGAACNTGLLGACAAGTMTCIGGSVECQQDTSASQEICGNAVDENCDGVATQAPSVYFDETFADNSKGWSLGTTWAIGPTATSSGQSYGFGDPALDHTPTADNGVGGVVLGGNAPTTIHGYYYLTSPVIDASSGVVPGSLYLEFWRWLNSDYTPYMNNVVEVFNGSSWVLIYQTGGNGTTQNTWQKFTYDITAYKNANLQFRFGYNIGSSGVYTVSSWNVDDVQLTSAICN